jgi:hypothetical protein
MKKNNAFKKDDTPRGQKGAKARNASLTASERSLIAQKAAKQRWDTPVLQASHGSPDHPLKIGDIEIGCYVLEDGTRVLSQSSVISALGKRRGGGTGRGTGTLAAFLRGSRIAPYVSEELFAMSESPIKFCPPHGGNTAYGFPATILPEICDSILAARAAGALQSQQAHIAEQCEILVRGFARVGIIALIDEATGYEKERTANSLAEILEAFIAKELQPWLKTFPPEFYEELFRLRGLKFTGGQVKRPWYFGHLTNDIIYRRLAPGLLEELKRLAIKDDAGRLKHRLFRRLTKHVGYPKLREHLGAVVAIMQLSDDYCDFKVKLDRLKPQHRAPLPLPFPDGEVDDGKGF